MVASGRNEAPAISDSATGYRKLMDPYLTTYRANHKPFSVEDQYGIGAKDQITFYSAFDLPKVGFTQCGFRLGTTVDIRIHELFQVLCRVGE